MATTLKDRIRTARTGESVQEAPAVEVPAELGAVQGTEEVVPASSLKAMAWIQRYDEEFSEALPAVVDRAQFFAAVRAALPELTRCTPASVRQALLACARFGLLPDGSQAVVKRSGTTAVFVPMYRGLIALMHRSGQVSSVHLGRIYEGDDWSWTPTAKSPDDFFHKPRPEMKRAERGPLILVYAFAWMTDGTRSRVAVLSREDAEDIRNTYSEGYQQALAEGREDSFWHTDFDRMWDKSAVRELYRLMPPSAEQRALDVIDAAGDAGRAQVLDTGALEAAQLLAEAKAAHRAAEGPQTAPAGGAVLERERGVLRRRAARSKGKKQRGGAR